MANRMQRYVIGLIVLFPSGRAEAGERITMSTIDSPPIYVAGAAPGEKRGVVSSVPFMLTCRIKRLFIRIEH